MLNSENNIISSYFFILYRSSHSCLFSVQIPISNSNSIITFANAQNKQDVNLDCII